MARSNVGKFGNWEAEENVPYTAYFEKARKTRAPGAKITNPSDPEYNLDSQSQAPPSITKPEQEDPVRRSRDRMISRDEAEFKQFGHVGGSYNEAGNKRQGKVSQNSSYDNKSPLHKNSYDGTGRSKHKPSNIRGDENPEKVRVVPKFGDWNRDIPSSADGYGYTHIFDKVREERSSVTTSSRTPAHSSSPKPSKAAKNCCCFGVREN